MDYIKYLKMNKLIAFVYENCLPTLNKTYDVVNDNLTYYISNLYPKKTLNCEFYDSNTQIVSFIEYVDEFDYIVHN